MQRMDRGAALAVTALAVISWACHARTPRAGSRTMMIGSLGGACQFTPTAVALAVDSIAIIVPDSNCTGSPTKRKATVTWPDPQLPLRAGLNVDPACTKQTRYRTGVWKVTRCATGHATLTIYVDSVGTSVLQTIPIEDATP